MPRTDLPPSNKSAASRGDAVGVCRRLGATSSSCQHLISALLPRYHVCWVNTIGMRAPRFNRMTLRRAMEKVRPWVRSARRVTPWPHNLRVLDPKMWPWFSRGHDRWLNRTLLVRGLQPLIQHLPRPVVGITTLPIVADLMKPLRLDRWVYYCVDDFSQWPGLDQRALATMEDEVIANADRLIAASRALQSHLASHGKASELLTHGVDLNHWRTGSEHVSGTMSPPGDAFDLSWRRLEPPLVVFWGLIDQRMDLQYIQQLAASMKRGTIVLAGPAEHPDPALFAAPRVARLAPLDYALLPRLAADAAALIMPYADLPVTRAMQPLKLNEYLATDRPVVARALPAVAPWADALDAVASPAEFVAAVHKRLAAGCDPAQLAARQRLQRESWQAKADLFEHWALRFE